MSWFDYLLITAFTLANLWTWRHFSRYSNGSATEAQEVETLQDLVVRLAAENRQLGQRYERLEQDYLAGFQEVEKLRGQLDHRTKLLENCRRLLANQQGIEDSSL